MVQGELFIDESEARSGDPSSFLSKNQIVLRFDKLILVGIGAVVLFIFTYSFGYEQGRSTAERKMETLTAQIQTLSAPAIAEVAAPSVSSAPIQSGDENAVTDLQANLPEAPISSEAEVKNDRVDSDGKYTIQIATAVSKESAEREIRKLVQKGFQSFFVQRGRYFEVCVGSFDTVASAKPVLSDFKTKGIYTDAFVRMNPRF